jgi:hypothetical protein
VKYSLNEVKGNTKGYGEAHPERDAWSCYLAKVHTAKLARTIKTKESLNDFIISRQRRLENTEKLCSAGPLVARLAGTGLLELEICAGNPQVSGL